MALTDGGNGGNEMVMPVAPMYGGGGSGFGGWGGDNGWWIILLFLFALGGWGNGFGGGYGGNGGMMPYVLNSTTNADVQRGFDQQSVMSGIAGLQSGISGLSTQLCGCCADVQQSLCNGFAGVNATVNSGFANAEASANARQIANMNQAYTNQIANMQQSFANQQAMNTGFNNLGSQFADCCCENRLGIADLKYTVATENCADRAALNDGLREVIVNQTANTQRILDKLCDQELQAERRENANLRSELMYARGQASQVEQTAQLLANNNAQTALFQQGMNNEVDALYNRLSSCPVPTTPVYGRTPIFTCGGNSCGCGCGGNAGLI